MKKVLLLSLGLVMGFSAFAQTRVAKNDIAVRKATAVKGIAVDDTKMGSVIDNSSRANNSIVANRYLNFEEAEAMITYYDLQSNGSISNRMYQNANGDVAVVATMSLDASGGAADRGTGYNFAAAGDVYAFAGIPEAREETNATGADLRTGWPTIAPYGANGEILVNHADGLNYWIRETAGEGQWDGPYQIPNMEEGYAMSWPRVATSGENNEIIHVIAAAQVTLADGSVEVVQYYCRSTDGENWDVNYSPLAETDEHKDIYGGDDYAIAANGDVVAIVYQALFSAHLYAYKSVDNGETWEKFVVWENPFPGDWETDESTITGGEDDPGAPTPVTSSVVVGPDGTVHVAFSTSLYSHRELGTSYYYYYPHRTIDGIHYWNDTRDPVDNTLRLWGPDPEQDPTGEYVFHSGDSINYCGWLPFYENVNDFTNENTYDGADDHYLFMSSASGYPALSVDPEGNLAMAYSAYDTQRTNPENGLYYRSTIMSYKKAGDEGWSVAVEHVMEDFMHTVDEVLFVNAAPTVTNVNEFWFSYSADDVHGLFCGNGATQQNASSNTCYVFKISSSEIGVEETEAKDVVYNVYPNPATDMIFVASSMDADATITFTNIAGQTVKVVNQGLTSGDNSVNISDLNTGVYFCTVTANGFSHTSKVVVK